MTVDTFIVRPTDKNIVFIRTESGRFFKISNRQIRTDGLVPKAVKVSPSYVAELVARFGVKPRVRGKASNIRRFKKEEAA